MIPRREMGRRNTPESAAHFIKQRQLLPLSISYAQLTHRDNIGSTAAIQIQLGKAIGNTDNFNYQPIIRGYPRSLLAVIPACGHYGTGGKFEEVFHIHRQRLTEIDTGSSSGDGLIHTQFHRVGVATGRGKGPRHGFGAVIADGVFGSAYAQLIEGRYTATGQGHGGRGPGREEDGGLTATVVVGLQTALMNLEGLAVISEINDGDPAIQRNQHYVLSQSVVVPRGLNAALSRKESFLLVVDHQVAATVDSHIEAAALPTQRLTKFRVVLDGNSDAWQRVVFLVAHVAANDRSATLLNGFRTHAGLNRIDTGIKKFGSTLQTGSASSVYRSSDFFRFWREITGTSAVLFRNTEMAFDTRDVACLIADSGSHGNFLTRN